jgi:methionyl-tRNA formyltransferase
MQKDIRVIFAGTPDNAASTLEHLIALGINIVGVITRLDSKVGRSGTYQESAVAVKAVSNQIEVYKTNEIDETCRAWVKSLAPDIGVVVAYGVIFDAEFLKLPKSGWLNLHYSFLPALRGAAPVQNAILRGLEETGVSVFLLDEGIDTGPLVRQEAVAIGSSESAGELLRKLTDVGAELLATVLMGLESNLSGALEQPTLPPDEIARKPTRQSAKLSFTESSNQLSRKIRAMNPEPMAWFEFEGTAVRVLRARPTLSAGAKVGSAQLLGKDLVVACGEGGLALETIQPAGKSAMSGSDWFRGLQTKVAFFE